MEVGAAHRQVLHPLLVRGAQFFCLFGGGESSELLADAVSTTMLFFDPLLQGLGLNEPVILRPSLGWGGMVPADSRPPMQLYRGLGSFVWGVVLQRWKSTGGTGGIASLASRWRVPSSAVAGWVGGRQPYLETGVSRCSLILDKTWLFSSFSMFAVETKGEKTRAVMANHTPMISWDVQTSAQK